MLVSSPPKEVIDAYPTDHDNTGDGNVRDKAEVLAGAGRKQDGKLFGKSYGKDRKT